MRTFKMSGAKIGIYPAGIKPLYFVTDAEIMGSIEWARGQVGIIKSKTAQGILLSRYFYSQPGRQS
jgi:hypothetical protein